ncbi:7-deoxyloganetin glucosyltransferase-like [Apium graveolens]|uniref:7-deoxyloganetin glucosyltransferase-like n=1 Tax=Apium graveolens TaxID=4045 RepID=UPI003D7BDDF1
MSGGGVGDEIGKAKAERIFGLMDGFLKNEPVNWFEEEDATLDDRGLASLSACQMDSLAKLEYPETGYNVEAVSYDNPIPGYGTSNTINLRLWAAKPSGQYDMVNFLLMDFIIFFAPSLEANSVLYMNLGSVTVMSAKHLSEFAWGLGNSKKHFHWVIRPDVVTGDSAMFPQQFLSETENRGTIASWCTQEQVLNHPENAGFLTHNGWNSTIEIIAAGVTAQYLLAFFAEQTNCRYCCVEWGIGMEIDNNVKREEVELLVRV